jgi:Tfp pilus assembly protein PilN
MKIPINLASQPFRRDRPLVAASIALSAVLAALLVVLLFFIAQDRDQLAGMHRDVTVLNRQIHDASVEQTRLEGIMHQPQNASVLYWSVLINTLIYQKAISWSKLFADLETVLPPDVELVAIHPQVDSANHVKLDMMLGAQKPDAILAALRALANSSSFGTTRPISSIPPTQAEPLHRFRLTVNYAQKL